MYPGFIFPMLLTTFRPHVGEWPPRLTQYSFSVGPLLEISLGLCMTYIYFYVHSHKLYTQFAALFTFLLSVTITTALWWWIFALDLGDPAHRLKSTLLEYSYKVCLCKLFGRQAAASMRFSDYREQIANLISPCSPNHQYHKVTSQTRAWTTSSLTWILPRFLIEPELGLLIYDGICQLCLLLRRCRGKKARCSLIPLSRCSAALPAAQKFNK